MDGRLANAKALVGFLSQMSAMFGGSSALLLIEHLGEPVEYVPAVGAVRPITAIVERSTFGAIPEMTRSVAPQLTVTVLNDATRGISRAELNAAGDFLRVAVKAGGALERRAIGHIEIQEGGMLRLQVR